TRDLTGSGQGSNRTLVYRDRLRLGIAFTAGFVIVIELRGGSDVLMTVDAKVLRIIRPWAAVGGGDIIYRESFRYEGLGSVKSEASTCQASSTRVPVSARFLSGLCFIGCCGQGAPL